MQRHSLALVVFAASACAQQSPPMVGASNASHQRAGDQRHSERIEFGVGVRLVREGAATLVEVDAQVAMREGWLEQLVCKAGTREHESLLAVEASPRMIHAALLASGLTPGAPGSWLEGAPDATGAPTFSLVPPRGDRVELRVKWTAEGVSREAPLCSWVRRAPTANQAPSDEFPCTRFVFAGSLIRPNPPSWPAGEHFVADFTGSIVGLVTFGDEVIAFDEVIPDKVDIAPPLWEARTQSIPREGTPVTLTIERAP